MVDQVLTVMGRFLECGSDTSLTKILRSGPMKESDRVVLFFVTELMAAPLLGPIMTSSSAEEQDLEMIGLITMVVLLAFPIVLELVVAAVLAVL